VPTINKPWPKRARDRIKATKIIEKMQGYVLDEGPELSASQIRCAEILLKKCLPDMSFVEHQDNNKKVVKLDAEALREAERKLEPLRLVNES
jgi:hypothetical protein